MVTKPMQRRRRPSLSLSLSDEIMEPEVFRADQHGKKHGKDTPRSLTDAALLKSQLLLHELEQLGLLEDLSVQEPGTKQLCESDMSTMASLSDSEISSESSTAEASQKLDVVQVPSQLLEMLATMWQEMQHLRSKASIQTDGHQQDSAMPLLKEHLVSKGDPVEKTFDSWPLPNQSVMSASPRDSLFPRSPGTLSTMTPRDSLIMSSSTDAGSSLLGSVKSSYTTRSLESCTTSCMTLTEEDKNLLKELRDLLRSGTQSKLATAVPLQRAAVPDCLCIPLTTLAVPMHIVKTTTVTSSPLQLQRRTVVQAAPALQAAPVAQAPTRFVHPRRSVLV